jgi:hypothetical protein
MSTPIETNTEELQEILETVNNLPSLGGSEYDLELIANMPEDIMQVVDLSAEHITVNGNYETLKAKIMSGKGIKAVLRHSYEHTALVYHNTVPAFSAGFTNVFGGDSVFAEFLINGIPGASFGTIYVLHVLLGADNSIVVNFESIETANL